MIYALFILLTAVSVAAWVIIELARTNLAYAAHIKAQRTVIDLQREQLDQQRTLITDQEQVIGGLERFNGAQAFGYVCARVPKMDRPRALAARETWTLN